jgi:hypothetical protein
VEVEMEMMVEVEMKVVQKVEVLFNAPCPWQFTATLQQGHSHCRCLINQLAMERCKFFSLNAWRQKLLRNKTLMDPNR